MTLLQRLFEAGHAQQRYTSFVRGKRKERRSNKARFNVCLWRPLPDAIEVEVYRLGHVWVAANGEVYRGPSTTGRPPSVSKWDKVGNFDHLRYERYTRLVEDPTLSGPNALSLSTDEQADLHRAIHRLAAKHGLVSDVPR